MSLLMLQAVLESAGASQAAEKSSFWQLCVRAEFTRAASRLESAGASAPASSLSLTY
jgi:hypothetical protein